MSDSSPAYATLEDWVAREAIGFSVDSPESLDAAVNRMVGSLGGAVELLGLGEAMHGWREVLVFRNRVFRRLVEAHGFSAVAIESSFPRGRVVDEYVAGRAPASVEAVWEAGFSHGFGRLEATRQLVEWMRGYNAEASHRVKLRFYGFDSPTEMTGTDSPRQLLRFVLDYLDSVRGAGDGERRRRRIESLLGDDADWENPAAMMDPAKSIGLSPAATALRIEAEDLVTELHLRRPELAARGDDGGRYLEAAQHASVARWLLNYHAALARPSGERQRLVEGLGIRDAIMAENLAYAVGRERGRGRVLALAHNSHLKRGPARWQLGPHALAWWPAGSHLHEMLGPRYAVIGSGVGVSEAQGVGQPEAGTLEARLTAAAGPARFIATHGGRGLPGSAVDALPTRSGSATNPSYFPLSPQSLSDFDALVVLG